MGGVEYGYGDTAYGLTSQIACLSLLETGDRYRKAGDLVTSKEIYRRIITTYTGTMFQGNVKRAEFGLEDIKSAEEKEREQEKQLPPSLPKSTKNKK